MKRKIGGEVDAASSLKFKTGNWRTMRPVWDQTKCIQCQLCTIFCPDFCIPTKEEEKLKRTETNFDYCKGCGICAQVCPVKCISMKKEDDFHD